MEDKLKHKNLLVRLSLDLHSEIKIMAIKKNQTLSSYVRRALVEAIKKDNEHKL